MSSENKWSFVCYCNIGKVRINIHTDLYPYIMTMCVCVYRVFKNEITITEENKSNLFKHHKMEKEKNTATT